MINKQALIAATVAFNKSYGFGNNVTMQNIEETIKAYLRYDTEFTQEQVIESIPKDNIILEKQINILYELYKMWKVYQDEAIPENRAMFIRTCNKLFNENSIILQSAEEQQAIRIAKLEQFLKNYIPRKLTKAELNTINEYLKDKWNNPQLNSLSEG